MSQKKYWNGLEELNQTPAYKKAVDNEFGQDAEEVNESLLNAKAPRRDFLKYLGFSTAAATLAASCEMKVRKAIPYAIKPDAELQTPTVPNYYASTYLDNGEYCSVVVKTRDGRPIMIEGNKLCKITKGATTARVVAATLGLYDTARLRGPILNGKPVDTFKDIDAKVMKALSGSGKIALVTPTVNSPSYQSIINKFVAKYPNVKHVQYDAVSYSGILDANESSFGSRSIPSYRFDLAKTIFGLGCDFIGSWLSPAEYSSGYTATRKVFDNNKVMSRHYQVEGMMSLTGANADSRATCKPSEYGKVAAALLAAITSGTKPTFKSATLNKLILNAAADLKKGNGLVVCGSNDSNVQQIINAINSAIGAYGSTINLAVKSNYKKGSDAEVLNLVTEMNSGSVGAVIFCGVNPVYDFYNPEQFKAALKKVKTRISLNDRDDETSSMCEYKLPSSHWLESWGDVEPKTGYYSFMQPTISPLFKTRQFPETLLAWSGSEESYDTYFTNFWSAKLGSRTAFDKALQDGVAHPASETMSGGSASVGADVIAAATSLKGGEYELVVYESVAMGSGGANCNNPWLQELSDPVTKVAWDNYVMMSPKTAKKFNAELTGINQVEIDKRVVEITVGKNKLELPVVVTPGMNDAVIAVAVGYGRNEASGMAANQTGKNVYNLITVTNGKRLYSSNVSIKATESKYPIACSQTHLSSEDRPIVREYTLDEYKKEPLALIKDRKETLKHYIGKPWEHGAGHHEEELKSSKDFDARKFELDFAKDGTLYPVYESVGINWAMSIDLSTCTGCAACVIACHAENNVSIVGKDRVAKAQDMSWLRIDRYFAGDPDDSDSIQVIFQPMMCQHCDNAPCENVCPVSATNHSNEGLNQMAYNRCIGTKYCANNCPYKVRRFNWFDFNGADSFQDNLFEDGRRDIVNDELTRMVLNPDVTVRSRGVMEKCSFCVQRLQDGKLKAKKEGVPVQDQHISTACQTACNGDSITFGNLNDTSSNVYKERYEKNKERLFYVLEEIHVLPSVSYFAKIKNTDKVVSGTEKDGLFKQHI